MTIEDIPDLQKVLEANSRRLGGKFVDERKLRLDIADTPGVVGLNRKTNEVELDNLHRFLFEWEERFPAKGPLCRSETKVFHPNAYDRHVYSWFERKCSFDWVCLYRPEDWDIKGQPPVPGNIWGWLFQQLVDLLQYRYEPNLLEPQHVLNPVAAHWYREYRARSKGVHHPVVKDLTVVYSPEETS